MALFLSMALISVEMDPPSGGVSPLAWVIIMALVGTIGVIWGVALGWIKTLYADLKACNAARADSEEDTLGLLKVLRAQMEKSRGGGR
jgi:hypothetical protein